MTFNRGGWLLMIIDGGDELHGICQAQKALKLGAGQRSRRTCGLACLQSSMLALLSYLLWWYWLSRFMRPAPKNLEPFLAGRPSILRYSSYRHANVDAYHVTMVGRCFATGTTGRLPSAKGVLLLPPRWKTSAKQAAATPTPDTTLNTERQQQQP